MEDQSKVKSEERQKTDHTEKLNSQFKCMLCSKTFSKQSDLDSHIKIKHEKQQSQGAKPRPTKIQPRNRVLQMQQNQHQDTIYSYLGELGQKNQENTSRQELLLADENQRQSIQTNYSFNKVVRTPYQKQIIPIKVLPSQWIEKSPDSQFIKGLESQMIQLYQALDAEKQKWQFRDPMAPEEQAQDQFSLMQIRKLILNYPRRKLNLKYPHFCIFLLWVGRICKSQAWEQFFMIFSYYLAQYYSKRNLALKPSQRWQQFNIQFNSEPIKSYLSQKLSICDEKTVKKLIQFFNKWVILFDLVNQFC